MDPWQSIARQIEHAPGNGRVSYVEASVDRLSGNRQVVGAECTVGKPGARKSPAPEKGVCGALDRNSAAKTAKAKISPGGSLVSAQQSDLFEGVKWS